MKVHFSSIVFSMTLTTPHSCVFVVSMFYTVSVLAGSYCYVQVTQPASENAGCPSIALMRHCSDFWISAWIKWQVFSPSCFLSDNILEWGRKENKWKYFLWKMLSACKVIARFLLILSGAIKVVEHWTCLVIVEKFMQDLKEHQKGRIPARRESFYFISY